MEKLQNVGVKTADLPSADSLTFEQIAKELCRIVRLSLRDHSVAIEWLRERLEEDTQRNVCALASSQRNPAAIIAHLFGSVVGAFDSKEKKFGTPLEVIRSLAPFGGVVVTHGADCWSNSMRADQTLLEAAVQNSRRFTDDTFKKHEGTESQLRDFLEALRQINNELAQTMRSIKP